MSFQVVVGDCVEVMVGMDADAVDAIVTDPPYGIGFMGKDWDSPGGTGDFPMRRSTEANTVNTGVTRQGGRQRSTEDFAKRQARDAHAYQVWTETWAVEALRILKPGGHLLAFGGTRTYHRLACGLEDAGFEIRDCLAWLYGSGFPKSLDVSKALDKRLGAEREVIGTRRVVPGVAFETTGPSEVDVTAPATAAAAAAGWGTALKPAFEPIVLARKSLGGTVADNWLEHGTGALNIDGTRIEHASDDDLATSKAKNPGCSDLVTSEVYGAGRSQQVVNESGRWPANVVLDDEAAALLNEQSGQLPTGRASARSGGIRAFSRSEVERDDWGLNGATEGRAYDDEQLGGASRFFYVAKADREERNRGLEHLRAAGERPLALSQWEGQTNGSGERMGPSAPSPNNHPTVKPVALMQWLCRLVTPPKGLVLDPFMGSGTTGMAALREGFEFVGIEREPDYAEIARARILGDAPLFNQEVMSEQS